jgi:hypothetical protein
MGDLVTAHKYMGHGCDQLVHPSTEVDLEGEKRSRLGVVPWRPIYEASETKFQTACHCYLGIVLEEDRDDAFLLGKR